VTIRRRVLLASAVALGTLVSGALPAATRVEAQSADSASRKLVFEKRITGRSLFSKSLGISPTGLVFSQNMMYRHNVTVFDRTGKLVKVIPDTVDLKKFGIPGKSGLYKGSPVEVAFSPNGRKAYVSNYQMYGKGYSRPGNDKCAKGRWDKSFVYRIDIPTLTIDQVIPVGAVPKYVAVTPDGSKLVVSNWCSYSVSIINIYTGATLKELPVGRFPRGIAITSDSTYAYIAVMGANRITKVNLRTYATSNVKGAGTSPRHLILSPDNKTLYVSNNLANAVRKITLATGRVRTVVSGKRPRSMALSADGTSLYVVNFYSDTVSKIRTSDFKVLQRLNTKGVHPIGITYDPVTRRVWVANYRGSIAIFQER
jgi:YVTN family beta-propeller protein